MAQGESEAKVHLSGRARWRCSLPMWINPQEGCTLEREMLFAAERIPARSLIEGRLLTVLQQLEQHVLPWRGIWMANFCIQTLHKGHILRESS